MGDSTGRGIRRAWNRLLRQADAEFAIVVPKASESKGANPIKATSKDTQAYIFNPVLGGWRQMVDGSEGFGRSGEFVGTCVFDPASFGFTMEALRGLIQTPGARCYLNGNEVIVFIIEFDSAACLATIKLREAKSGD